MDNFKIKTPGQIQAELAQPEISANNNNRLGAAALGVPVLGAVGYLGTKALESGKETADGISKITPSSSGHAIGVGAKDAVVGTKEAWDQTGRGLNRAGDDVVNFGSDVSRDIQDFGSSVAKGFNGINESTLIIPGTTLSYMVEENIDFKALGQKAKDNAGLLIGGLGAGIATGMAMDDQVLHDAAGKAYSPDLGVSALGGAMIGTAGAGVGHVIHNTIKKNTEDGKAFQDYKAMNTMPPMPSMSDMPMPSMPDKFKY